MTTVEVDFCLINMNVTFELTEIKEMMPQQARKQLEAELGTSCCSLGGVRCLYTAVWSVQSSPVKSIVQSSPESRFYRNPNNLALENGEHVSAESSRLCIHIHCRVSDKVLAVNMVDLV